MLLCPTRRGESLTSHDDTTVARTCMSDMLCCDEFLLAQVSYKAAWLIPRKFVQ